MQNKQFIFCASCGDLLRIEKFGDVLSMKDINRLKRVSGKHYCLKCKLLKRLPK